MGKANSRENLFLILIELWIRSYEWIQERKTCWTWLPTDKVQLPRKVQMEARYGLKAAICRNYYCRHYCCRIPEGNRSIVEEIKFMGCSTTDSRVNKFVFSTLSLIHYLWFLLLLIQRAITFKKKMSICIEIVILKPCLHNPQSLFWWFCV